MAKKWIQKAIKRPGAFRRWLKKKKGEKVTTSDIKRGKGSKSTTVKRMANLARTLAKLRKGKK